MKKIYFFILAILLLGALSTRAQNTDGTEFWLTFGKNYLYSYNDVDLQIRIMSRELPTQVTIEFTALGTSESFVVPPWGVYTYPLKNSEKEAVYNTVDGTSERSIRITSEYPITAYALNQGLNSTDATNLLPVSALGTNYYQISYQPMGSVSEKDAYAVVATEDNTELSHNGTVLGTLNTGWVYYKTSETDMTGAHVTTNKPAAFFALNQNAMVPNPSSVPSGDCLMQQLAPVHTWGKTFLVPVSNETKDRLRIVASQNNTHISQTGGVIQTVSGGQTGLTLQAGQFVELEVELTKNGCYLTADKPVGICSYLTSMNYVLPNSSDPAQVWLPSIEQITSEGMISPFIPSGSSNLVEHYALVITPTAKKEETTLSIGGGTPAHFTGDWKNNSTSGISFCSFQMTNPTAVYHFTNPKGIIVMGYGKSKGINLAESYYYLGYSAMRTLSSAFYANNVHYQDLPDTMFCEHTINITTVFAEIEKVTSINWYINDVLRPELANLFSWTDNFPSGVDTIKMSVNFQDGSTIVRESILRIGAIITTSVSPAGYGTATGDGCFEPGDAVTVIATPNGNYTFLGWTVNGDTISTSATYNFTATTSLNLVANFVHEVYTITLLKDPDSGGSVAGAGEVLRGALHTVTATPSIYYNFVEWTTENDSFVCDSTSHKFTVWESCTLVAKFTPKKYNITVTENDLAMGTACCDTTNIEYGTYYTVTAVPEPHYVFEYWSEGDTVPVSLNDTYTFLVERSYNLVANFKAEILSITLIANPSTGGNVYGSENNITYGEERTVRAVPFLNSNFICWSDENGDCVSYDSVYTFIVEHSVTLVANFTLKSYTITVVPNDAAGGTCTGGGNFLHGAEISVTATPVGFYQFVEWREDTARVSIESTYTFTVTRSRDLVAIFEPYSYSIDLMVHPTEGGIAVGGGDHIAYGDTVTVLAIPNDNYVFDRWTVDSINGAVVSNDIKYKFNVTRSCLLIAHFTPKTYTITVSRNLPAGGTVTGDATNLSYNQNHTVLATVNPNYYFVGWKEKDSTTVISTLLQYDFPVTRSLHLVAHYALNTYLITLEAYPVAGGSVSGAGIFAFGDTVIASAVASPYFYFVNWTENDTVVSTDANFIFSATHSRHLVANFSYQDFKVELFAAPVIGGTVSGGGANIPYLSKIIISATPEPCYDFKCWTRDGDTISTTAIDTLIVTQNQTLIAHFVKKVYVVTASVFPVAGGTVSITTEYVPCGNTLTVIATPYMNSEFINWTINGVPVCNDSIYSFTVTNSCHLVANFNAITYTVNLSADPPFIGGTVTGAGTYPQGWDLTVRAHANPEFIFEKWTENGVTVSTDTAYQFTVDNNRTLVAHFVTQTFDIVLSADPSTAGNVAGGGTNIPYNTVDTVTATPNLHYVFDSWTEEGYPGTVSLNSVYSFSVTRSRHLIANFILESHEITLTPNIPAGGALQGAGMVSYGMPTTIKAIPNPDFIFLHWARDSINGPVFSSASIFSFTVTESLHLVAIFKLKSYNVSVLAYPTAGGTVSGGGLDISHGTNVSIAASTNECFDFVNWTEGDSIVATTPVHSFTVTASHTFVANFTQKVYAVTTSSNPPQGGITSGGSANIYCGANITVSAIPHPGYQFVNWTKEGVSVSNDSIYTFMVKDSCHLVANFVLKTYNIYLEPSPLAGGFVSGGGTYAYGDTITVRAKANPEYKFEKWTENGVTVSTDTVYRFIVTGSRYLIAHFITNTFDITLEENPPAGGTTSGGGLDIPYGTTVNLTATPNLHYVFINWTEDGDTVSTSPYLSFPATRSRHLVANFELEKLSINLLPSPYVYGTVIGGGNNISYGTTINILAQPNFNCTFKNWTIQGTSSVISADAFHTFTVTESLTLLANFELKTFNITTSSEPPQGGTTSGGGMNIPYGEMVPIVAIPNPNYHFVGWTEDTIPGFISTDSAFSFPAHHSLNMVAHFALDTYTITLEAIAAHGGTVTGGGVIEFGTDTTIMAVASPFFSFRNWTIDTPNGPVFSLLSVDTFSVTQSLHLVANFIADTFSIRLSANPYEGGTVSGGGTGIPYLTEIEITATPNECYEFVNWTTAAGDLFSTDSVYSFFVTETLDLVANFAIKTQNILASVSSGEGEISPEGNTPLSCGDTITFTFIPEMCYRIDSVFIDGVPNPDAVEDGFYIFENVTDDHTISVHFALTNFTITASAGANGTISSSGTIDVGCGNDTTFYFTPNDCFRIDQVLVDGINDEDAVENGSYTFENVSDDHTIAVSFVKKTFTVTTATDPLGGGITSGDGTGILCGTEVIISIIPTECYHFVNWTKDGNIVSTAQTFSYLITDSSHFIAHFTQEYYDITTSASPIIGGTTSGDSLQIPCRTDIIVHAVPNIGYIFTHWTKNDTLVSTDADYTLTAMDSYELVAHFEEKNYTVTLCKVPFIGGQVLGDGIYPRGDTATIEAFPNPEYQFVCWIEDGDTVSKNFQHSFTVESDRTLCAHFTIKKLNITLEAKPVAGGTVSGGGTNILYGSHTNIFAEADTNYYVFVNWTEDSVVVSTASNFSFIVSKSRHLVANFKLKTYNIIALATPGGTVGGGGYNISLGEQTSVHAYPDPIHDFIEWREGALVVSTDKDYYFTVERSRTLVAIFEPKTYEISTVPSPAVGGYTTGDGTFSYGAFDTIQAFAYPNYHFVCWMEDTTIISNNAEYIFPVTRSRELTAIFALNTFTITLEANPPQGGVVSGGGANISYGAVITVVAVANPFFTFVKWTEDGVFVSDDSSFSFPVTKSRHLVAHFICETFNITVSANPPQGGTVSGGGTDIPYLTEVTVTAVPNACYNFTCWTVNGDTVSTNMIYKFDATEDLDLVANFVVKKFRITASANPPAGGILSIDTAYVDCGTLFEIVATPNVGYQFINWTKDGMPVSPDSLYQFLVTDSCDLVANFEYVTYTIILYASPFGSGQTYTSGVYPLGKLLNVNAIANPEFEFVNWTEDTVEVSSIANFSFTVNSDRILTANFIPKKFKVMLTWDPLPGGSVQGGGTDLPYDTVITVKAIPNPHFTFSHWEEEPVGAVSYSPNYTFPVTKSRDLKAIFKPDACNITLSANIPGGTLSGGGNNIPFGTPDTLRALPFQDYSFECWKYDSINGQTASTSYEHIFTVTQSRHFVAIFRPKNCNILVSANPGAGGIAWGGGTNIPYGSDTTVFARANANYVFVNWTEDGYPGHFSTDTNYSFEVTRSRNLIANFRLETYDINLTVSPPAGGWVEGGGTNIPFGTKDTIKAHPTNEYDFAYWAKDSAGGPMFAPDAVYGITVTESLTLVAIFTPKYFNIELSANPTAGGVVTGSGNYAFEETVQISAEANTNYVFVEWVELINDTLIPVSLESAIEFPATRSRKLIANFRFEAYNVILAVYPEGTGEAEETEYNISWGSEKEIKATPHEQYHFEGWWKNGPDGTLFSIDQTHKFTVTESLYLVAVFSKEKHNITLIAVPNDGGTLLGAGKISDGATHTITAIPDGCFDFIHWTDEKDSVITDSLNYTFVVEEDRTFKAHFKKHNINITTSANPLQGGIVTGEYLDIFCGNRVTVTATPYPEYNFTGWTKNGEIVSYDTVFTFVTTESCHLVANFVANKYIITLMADPPDEGSVSEGGEVSYGSDFTASAYPRTGFSFIHWTEDSVVVSTDTNYIFTVERSRNLVAHFEKTVYTVKIIINDTLFGYASGAGKYDLNHFLEVKAFTKPGYQFANWMVDSVVVSYSNIYGFFVTKDITLVANFYDLDFDTYAVTLWDNTFMLNLNKFAKEGYEVVGCRWFKNNREELDTKTIDEFSYSAGPKKTDLLEIAPTFYMFQVITKDGTPLNSSRKLLEKHTFKAPQIQTQLVVYPNPVSSGNWFTIENLTADTPVEVYNLHGVCISRTIANDTTVKLTLNLPSGIYFIRNQNKEAKLTIIK